MCGLCFYNLFKTGNFDLGAILLPCLVSELQEQPLLGHEPTRVFWCFGLCLCNILIKTNNFGVGTIFLSCLLSELLELPLLRHIPMTGFQGCGLFFCNLFFKTKNFGHGPILLSCLVSELHIAPSPGLELRTIFWSFDLYKKSYWSQAINIPSLVQISWLGRLAGRVLSGRNWLRTGFGGGLLLMQ